VLVDAEKIFSDAAPGGIIGIDQIYEHAHMTPGDNDLLARTMFAETALQFFQGTQGPSLCLKQSASGGSLAPVLIVGGWRMRYSGGCRTRRLRIN